MVFINIADVYFAFGVETILPKLFHLIITSTPVMPSLLIKG